MVYLKFFLYKLFNNNNNNNSLYMFHKNTSIDHKNNY